MTRLLAAFADDLDVDPRELAIATAQGLIAAPFVLIGLVAFCVLLVGLSPAR